MIKPGARESELSQFLALVEDPDSTVDFTCALNVHTFLSRERKSISRESDAQLNAFSRDSGGSGIGVGESLALPYPDPAVAAVPAN